jgi:hypothetical protein
VQDMGAALEAYDKAVELNDDEAMNILGSNIPKFLLN